MEDLKQSLKGLGWYDLFFTVPIFLLFAYLPNYNFITIFLNIVIIIFFSIGLILTTHIIIDNIKNNSK
ncbi:TPA: hypothetical protein PP871_000112 [Staphylococcus aureus]|uniref:DUF6007 family protein n=1 Tax=Staphylococcus schweitzeri TaxID=1654388 RepID=UPI000500624B|nr:DUF6007 family protein [Staphylococcus schweitzeri]HDJ2892922.1 hypothetical protein [Staphylococcus aureus]CDR23156.1 hypothetical protein ERS140162_00373 [Staphylococcus schweitzeri]CDR66396.1 hypothetical protein ERS140167_01270 [Staphylococcus schweitzeri]HDJ2899244.1 hypothetical protein [Staphylococcus aureus]HDJ2901450.1 hypothetical protein [Staphylococcus aureus]